MIIILPLPVILPYFSEGSVSNEDFLLSVAGDARDEGESVLWSRVELSALPEGALVVPITIELVNNRNIAKLLVKVKL